MGGIIDFDGPSEGLELLPGETRIYNVVQDQEILTVNVDRGTIETYFFESEPGLTALLEQADTDTYGLSQGAYVYYSYYCYPGSNISLTWNNTAGVDLEFFVFRGESNLRDFEQGYNVNYLANEEKEAGNYSISIVNEDVYYFAFENLNSGTTLQVEFEAERWFHDVSTAEDSQTGSYERTLSEGENYIVFKNTGTNLARLSYRFGESTNYTPYYVLGGILVVLVIIGIASYSSSKKQKAKGGQESQGLQSQSGQQIRGLSGQQSQSQQQPQQPQRAKYNVRMRICSFCGAELKPKTLKILGEQGEAHCMDCGSHLSVK